MKYQFIITTAALLSCGCSVVQAQEISESTFYGLFVGEEVLGKGDCEIVAAEMLVASSTSMDTNFDDDAARGEKHNSLVLDRMDQIARGAKEKGYNAVVNFRLGLSQSTDFVTESGTTWRNGGRVFSSETLGTGFAYGDAVKLKC